MPAVRGRVLSKCVRRASDVFKDGFKYPARVEMDSKLSNQLRRRTDWTPVSPLAAGKNLSLTASRGFGVLGREPVTNRPVQTQDSDTAEVDRLENDSECPECGEIFKSPRGMKTHHAQSHPDTSLPGLDEDTLRRLYKDQGLTLREVVDEVGYNSGFVYKKMVGHGIKARSKKEARSSGHVPFRTGDRGYEEWGSSRIRVHQLLAINEGADPYKVFSKGGWHVHHKNNIPWDNRPENIELVDSSVHQLIHYDHSRAAPWQDRKKLAKAYARASMQRVADEWGCSRSTIRYWLDKFEIEKRPPIGGEP